jgi:hypothetical protein
MEDNAMADLALTQAEADALIAMEKHRLDDQQHQFPWHGEKLTLQLQSPDRREKFLLDVDRQKIDLSKTTLQNRARQVIVLLRLDLGDRRHQNPDGQEVGCPHLHGYREGFGDKYAIPVPVEVFSNTSDPFAALFDFMRYCNITEPPDIQRGLFA